MKNASKSGGFTIVELLIVIVVIAILAAISIVAYNSIQRRAQNTAIISAAEQSFKLIQSYVAANNEYPLTGQTACITDASGCAEGSNTVGGSQILTDALREIGQLPRNAPKSGNTMYGVLYTQTSSRTYEGQPDSAIIYYYLNGTAQQCGLSRVANGWGGELGPSSSGYTAGNIQSSGKTLCVISIPHG